MPGEPFKEVLRNISFSYGGSVVSIQTEGYYHFIEFFIRKLAHLTVYFALSFFVVRFLIFLLKKRLAAIIIAVVFIAIFAASDEIHQSFTGDRTPMVQDVILDFIGGVIAALISGVKPPAR